MVKLADFEELARERMVGAPEGDALTPLEQAMVRLGLAVSVTSLAVGETRAAIAQCLDLGATPEQVQEIVSMISGLGVHSLMISASFILDAASDRSLIDREKPLSVDQTALWKKHVGSDPFWQGFEQELPGFLSAMLRLSPDQFVAFFDYCAVPWKIGSVRARLKELIAMASDATPAHMFMPGFKLHLRNAIALGAGSAAVQGALTLAAQTPAHSGVD